MSKIFYDHLIKSNTLEERIRVMVTIPEEREELWTIVDEIIHQEVLCHILDHLQRDYHEEFLTRFYELPHSSDNMLFLNDKVGEDFENKLSSHIAELITKIEKELE